MKVFMSALQQLEPVVLVMPLMLDVDAIGVIEPPRLMVQGLGKPGDVTMGLTPPLLSSVESRGIEPTGATPGAEPAVAPLKVDAALVVPDAVPPAPQPDDVDAPIVLVSMPAPSKVEAEPVMPEIPVPDDIPVPDTPDMALPDIPAARHGFVLAIEPNGDGLRPPGESSVAPSGIPTGPTAEVAPGIPSGVVAPIAGTSGAI
jgi:hypothetical protein